ncbi:MAG: DUF1624 domain-containing protein [Desulfobacteraceae bacterium]|nr:DUF1624 domain-containing protein [Desulfobacteraceae bacterium]
MVSGHFGGKEKNISDFKQSKRIEYLDFARGLAILFMILQHSLVVYAVDGGETSLLGGIFVLLGTAPAAPVFMVIMGLFFMRPKTIGVSYGIKRGLTLIALGYVLNVFRFYVPILIATKFHANLPEFMTPVSFLLSVDILQLAGLSLIFMSLIRCFLPTHQWTRGTWIFLILIIMIVLIISPLLWGKFGYNPSLSPFFGDGETIFFPFFPWVVYPVFGMLLSHFLLNPKEKFIFKKLVITGLLVTFIGAVLWTQVSNAIIVQGDYHRSGLAVHFVIIGFILIWLPLCKIIFNQTRDFSFIHKILLFWSKNTTVIYFIQWVLYGWGILIFGCELLSVPASLFIGVVMCLLSHALTRIFVKLKRKYQ